MCGANSSIICLPAAAFENSPAATGATTRRTPTTSSPTAGPFDRVGELGTARTTGGAGGRSSATSGCSTMVMRDRLVRSRRRCARHQHALQVDQAGARGRPGELLGIGGQGGGELRLVAEHLLAFGAVQRLQEIEAGGVERLEGGEQGLADRRSLPALGGEFGDDRSEEL